MENLIEHVSTQLSLNINTFDIDAAGHVNNTVYVLWLEQLRTKLFEEYFGFRELFVKNYYPVVTSTEISYRRMLKLFDCPVGIMSVECCSHGIIMLNADILLNEIVVASGKQRCVIVDLVTSKIIKGAQLRTILRPMVEQF